MKLLLALLPALALTGCAHAFACKGFPQFSACKSATQAYRSTNKGAPPEYVNDLPVDAVDGLPQISRQIAQPGESHAERGPARTLKIWQAPFEDAEGDLIGSSTILTEVEPRRWRMGQTQTPVPRRLLPLQVTASQRPPAQPPSEDRGGFPLFPSTQGARRLHVEEVDYREP
ncbi:MAG: hypothetical protein RLZ25_261 [Pseudomonadota bacterium]|jgi:hypothetical protein